MGKFEPGHEKLPGAGMQKGQVTKKCRTISRLIDHLASIYDEKQLTEDFAALQPRDRVFVIVKLADKHYRITHDNTIEKHPIVELLEQIRDQQGPAAAPAS